ncbi:MAG: hypothetical protein HUJ26_10930 [Planctomycetaceae bacterium]|nr:hypothetical protein [Planctomycetaceae bacterium]
MNASYLLPMGVILLFPLGAAAQDNDTDDLLARCQGRWVRLVNGEKSKNTKYTMEFDDHTRTTTLQINNAIVSYVDNVSITSAENLTFLTAKNRRAVEGKIAGKAREPSVSILRIRVEKTKDGTTFEKLVLANGLFNDSTSAPRLATFVRLEENKSDNSSDN